MSDTMMRDASMGCLACGTRVIGPYCYHCGQKNDDCRRSIVRLAAETVTDAAAIDGRFVRTARQTLTRPGSHVRQYADGRRSPFTPPIRYFLVITFLFFTTLWLTDRHIFVAQVMITEDAEAALAEVAEELSDIDAVAAAFDEYEANGGGPAPFFRGGFLTTAEEVSYTEEQIAWLRDRISIDEGATINGRLISDERIVNTIVSTAQNPSAFNNALNGWIPRLMILFIPLMALLGTVFVRGKDALVYDHLLLAIQTHAFAFLVLTLSLWTSSVLPPEAGATAFFLGLPLYYLMGLRGAFGRSWRKSIVATLFVMFIYSILFTIALALAGIASFMEIV